MELTRREFFDLTATLMLFGNSGPKTIDLGGQVKNYGAKRQETTFVILHCTTSQEHELQLVLNYFFTSTTNTHYLIDRNGDIYKIVPDDMIAFHAGTSRWNGHEGLNSCSVGVEFVGTNYESFTPEQYEAFRHLYLGKRGIKERFGIEDENVLYHGWVAYCNGRRTHKKHGLKGRHRGRHRGRKADPGFLFDRRAAGLSSSSAFDPDVASGYLSHSSYPLTLVIDRRQRGLYFVDDGTIIENYVADFDGFIPPGRFVISGKDSGPVTALRTSNKGGGFLMKFFPGRHGATISVEGKHAACKIATPISADSLRRIYDNILLGSAQVVTT